MSETKVVFKDAIKHFIFGLALIAIGWVLSSFMEDEGIVFIGLLAVGALAILKGLIELLMAGLLSFFSYKTSQLILRIIVLSLFLGGVILLMGPMIYKTLAR